MREYRVEILILPRADNTHDPEGAAIEKALLNLGFTGISKVRSGKKIILTLEAENEEHAKERVKEMLDATPQMYNPVVQDYSIASVRK